MNALPVMLRELTVASRRRETWFLRLAFGAGTGGAFAFGVFLEHGQGQVALRSLAIAGLVLCLLAGPYLTSDAISSEKREGTLGLLFLTPLSGLGIVLGKMLTHSLQVAGALLGTFPFLFLPILLGGVTWGEILRILLVLLITLLLSLACGILASTLGEEARGTSLGTVLSLLLLTFLPWAGPFLGPLLAGHSVGPAGLPQLSPMAWLAAAFESSFRAPGAPGFGISTGFRLYWSSVAIGLALGVLLIAAAGHLLARVWRRDAPRPADPSPFRREGAPPPARRSAPVVLADRLREPCVWLASRHLDEGPTAVWLRRVLVGFFVAMLFIAVATSHWQQGFVAACLTAYALHFVARTQAAWAVTRWLPEEHRAGSLELLLTTPVDESELAAAHHESLRRGFRRPLRTLLGVNAALELAVLLFWDHLHMDNHAGQVFSTFFVGGALVTLADFSTLRWLGLTEALRISTPARAAGTVSRRLMLPAWITLALAIVVITRNTNAEHGAPIMACWYGLCLIQDRFLVGRCRKALRAGFRPRTVP